VLCALGATLATLRALNLPVSILLGVVMLALIRPVQRRATQLVARRVFARLGAHMDAARFDDADALIEDLRGVYAYSAAATELLRVQEGTLLVLRGRFHEAARLFESIDRRRIKKELLPWMLNNLAWALARAGDGAQAVATARESMAASDDAGDRGVRASEDLRACQLGTLGTALVVAGEPAEAIAPLEQALARGGSNRLQTSRAFFLGEALRALAREDEARAAWRRAAEECPEHELARAAQQRLDAPAPPYRS